MAKRMGLAAAAQFCRRTGTSFRAGIDIVTLCRSETKQGSDYHKKVMHQVADSVANGRTLADSMREAGPKYFPSLLLAMVRLGEETGRLERTLLEVGQSYQHRVESRRAFMKIIAFPTLQFIAAIFVIALLIWIMGFLPKMPGTNAPFDVLGLGLYGNSGVVRYFLMVGLFAGIITTCYYAVRNNWLNFQALVPLMYQIPKIGDAIQTITLSRFIWTLAMSADAGLDPFRAIDLSLDSTDSEYYRSESDTAKEAIRNGATLEEALRKTDIFPDNFLAELEVAELSGTSAESLAHLARMYDEKAKMAMKVIGGFATGAIWLGLSGLLVFVILKMALRVFGVYQDAANF